MKSRLLCLGVVLGLVVSGRAQTVTPNESSIVVASPKKIGINLNSPTYYGAGELYKNLLHRNPGFEPDLYRDKFVAYSSGTPSTFTAPSQYDPVVANFWTGASFRLYRGSPKALVCSGAIASNTMSSSYAGPTYTFASACSTSVEVGDVIVLRRAIACTPEADWESSHAGWWPNISGGGKLVSDCATPYDGIQSLKLDASVSGSSAGVISYIDTAPWDIGLLFNGQFTLTGHYRTVGVPTFSIAARRFASSNAGNPLSCATQTFPASASWTTFTMVCSGSETNLLSPNPVVVNFTAQGGVVELDDLSFTKTSGQDPANTTVFRDELLTTLRLHCAGASLTGVPCELRDWAGQNADEIANTVKPIFERAIQVSSFGYDYAGGQGYPDMAVGLEEFLQLCKAIGAEPYYALPETTTPDEAANWIDYLNGSASTVYGAKRIANGEPASYLTVFPTTHLAMGNENWNESETGEGLGYRLGAPDLYYDYSTDAAGVWGAMRSSASWPSGGAGIDLVLGFQDGNANNGVTEAMSRTSATSGELAPYTQFYVGDTAPLASLWNPLMYEVVANTTNSATQFYQQGSVIKRYGKLNVYEFDNGTNGGSASLTQAVVDSFTDAAGYGTATALQALQHLSFGVVDQNFFSLSQYYFTVSGGALSPHNWGAVIDMGGATNAVRPQELGMRMVNAAIIGSMYSCPVSNPTTYNLPANHNGQSSNGTPAANAIPQEYTFCFESGKQRSMIAINVDIANSHAIKFGGAEVPAGTVTVTRYAPSSISYTNEAGGTGPTDAAPQRVSVSAPFSVANPSGDTLPPYSITRYDWTGATSRVPVIPTSTTLSSSNTSPQSGASIVLTASVSAKAATGSVSLMDGSTTIASAAVANGVATFIVSGITEGSHSYTAVYGGNSTYGGSASNEVGVSVGGPYFHTVFNEAAAKHPLNGTKPATAPAGAVWSDPNGDWSYLAGGGITSATPDNGSPVLIDTKVSNYTATFTYPAAGAYLLFRQVDSADRLKVIVYTGEIDLYSTVKGTDAKLATIYPSNTAASLVVTLDGATGTISCGGQTASGTIPLGLLTATVVGFEPQSANFVMSSIDIFPIGVVLSSTTTSLTASNLSPSAGSTVILTATVMSNMATGFVVFKDGASTLGTEKLSNGFASYSVGAIAAGSHSYSATYEGDSNDATSTSSAVNVNANGVYLQTAFNEYGAGHALNGTTPSVAPAGSTWSDPNGDWTYLSSGGISSKIPDLENPVLIDIQQTNYHATFTYPAYGATLLFRYVDLNNHLKVVSFSGEIGIYSTVGGKDTKLAAISPANTAASLFVTIDGSAATIICEGEKASGTIPASLMSSTKLGFQPPSANFVMSTITVTP